MVNLMRVCDCMVDCMCAVIVKGNYYIGIKSCTSHTTCHTCYYKRVYIRRCVHIEGNAMNNECIGTKECVCGGLLLFQNDVTVHKN